MEYHEAGQLVAAWGRDLRVRRAISSLGRLSAKMTEQTGSQ